MSHEFTTALIDGARVLSLGQALSVSHPGLLAQRHEAGFLIGELHAGEGDEPFIAEADSAGHIGPVVPIGVSPETAAILAAALNARPEAGAVALVRAPRLAAWGLANRALPVRYFQMFGYTNAEVIPVAAAQAQDVASVLAAHPKTPALLLNDGRTLVWGGAASRAIRLVLSLEEAAYVTALADRLGGAKDYPKPAREKIYASLQAQARQ